MTHVYDAAKCACGCGWDVSGSSGTIYILTPSGLHLVRDDPACIARARLPVALRLYPAVPVKEAA